MKNKDPLYGWDPELKLASCIIQDNKGNIFMGTATCHPQDFDMASEKTGCEIAHRRALINLLRAKRDELKIQLKALNQLYYSMNRSKFFNQNSYENRMLQRQIYLIKKDLTTIKEMLVVEQQDLRDYIKSKDLFYNKIRSYRQKNETV